MADLLEFFEQREPQEPLLKAALAHFWFVTIHPFDDGSGRIALAIADLQLARSRDSAQRFYSMSAQIRDDGYHTVDGVVSRVSGRAIGRAQDILGAILAKARCWKSIRIEPILEANGSY
jgi:Fic family protein